MLMKCKSVTTAILMSSTLFLSGEMGIARELRYAIGFPPGTTGDMAANTFAQRLAEASDGDLTARVFPATLLTFPEMSAGVRGGVADIGFTLGAYAPTETPNSNMIAETVMLMKDYAPEQLPSLAWSGAMMEYVLFNCPDCLAEFAAQDQVFTASSTAIYGLLCAKPIESLDSLKGRSVRATGANWARWAETVGMRPIAVNNSETFEAMSQGILECSISSPTEMKDLSLMTVIEDVVTNFPGGGFGSAFNVTVNRGVWQSMTDEQRRELLHGSAASASALGWGYYQTAEQALTEARANGINVRGPSEELQANASDFLDEDLKLIAATYSEKYGVKNGDESIAMFRDLYAKWLPLMQGVKSQQDLEKVFWDNIHSKIDVATYGM